MPREDIDTIKNTGMIVLLYDDESFLQKVMIESELWRVAIRKSQPLMEQQECFLDTLSSDIVHAVCYESETMPSLVSRIRSEAPTTGIVVLRSATEAAATRGLLLFSGADAFFDNTALPLEVVATLQALRRRGYAFKRMMLDDDEHDAVAYHHDGHSVFATHHSRSGPWSLSNDGWSLSSPSGKTVGLAASERHIMKQLMSNSPNVVKREALLMNENATQAQRRFVDVQISRIKQKFLPYGEKVPIRAVRGVGYIFLDG